MFVLIMYYIFMILNNIVHKYVFIGGSYVLGTVLFLLAGSSHFSSLQSRERRRTIFYSKARRDLEVTVWRSQSKSVEQTFSQRLIPALCSFTFLLPWIPSHLIVQKTKRLETPTMWFSAHHALLP